MSDRQAPMVSGPHVSVHTASAPMYTEARIQSGLYICIGSIVLCSGACWILGEDGTKGRRKSGREGKVKKRRRKKQKEEKKKKKKKEKVEKVEDGFYITGSFQQRSHTPIHTFSSPTPRFTVYSKVSCCSHRPISGLRTAARTIFLLLALAPLVSFPYLFSLMRPRCTYARPRVYLFCVT